MSRFDRYLLSQLLALFGFFSLVLVAIYWVNRAVSLFDQIIGGGQSSVRQITRQRHAGPISSSLK